ncbi:MAG: S-layer protein, partial [Clostridiaceae bacterium]|nr:S-layer protein [Clostridiaceae bacterium]
NTRKIAVFIVIVMLISMSISTKITFAETSSIKIELDKEEVAVGDLVKAEIKVSNVNNLSGFQFNIKYDPDVLEALDVESTVPSENSITPHNGTIIINSKYDFYQVFQENSEEGIINYSRFYSKLEQYRKDGVPEGTGTIAVIDFKVKRLKNTIIKFEDTASMPNAQNGTFLFDWNGNRHLSYEVVQQKSINEKYSNSFIVDVGSAKGIKGEKVKVPILLTNVPDGGINNCDLKLGYDKNKVEILEVTPGIITKNPTTNFSSSINDQNSNVVILYSDETAIGSELITADGEFAVLNVKIKEDAPEGYTEIKLIGEAQFASYDLEEIPCIFNNGGINIIKKVIPTPVPTATVTPTKKGSSGGGGGGGGGGGSGADADPTATPTVKPTSKPSSVTEPTSSAVPGALAKHEAYVQGYPDGTFKPENNITRAEAAAIFAKLLSIDKKTGIDSITTYNDVNSSHWASSSIELVSSMGLFKGYPDGTFMPNQNITRAEFATVVYKYLNMSWSQAAKHSFKDVKSGHWAKEYIETLAGQEFIKGYADGNFMPEAKIKRSESVALINRALLRGPLYDVKQTFKDVPESHWAFKDIAEASLTHNFTIDSNGLEYFKQ